jgi:hypothetical protein
LSLQFNVRGVVKGSPSIIVTANNTTTWSKNSLKLSECQLPLPDKLEQMLRPHYVKAVIFKRQFQSITHFKLDIPDVFQVGFTPSEIDVFRFPISSDCFTIGNGASDFSRNGTRSTSYV